MHSFDVVASVVNICYFIANFTIFLFGQVINAVVATVVFAFWPLLQDGRLFANLAKSNSLVFVMDIVVLLAKTRQMIVCQLLN